MTKFLSEKFSYGCPKFTLSDCFFNDEQSAYLATGAKTDQNVLQAIADEKPCITATKSDFLNVEKFRRVDLNWTIITHNRTELETLWLTEGPWVDENVLDALRKIRPGNLREEDILSFKYQLKY